jgi:WD40 repeat protein
LARRLPGLPQRIYSLAWTADAARLAVAGGLPGTSGEVRLVAATDGGVVKELGHFSDVAFRAVLHPAGSKLAVAAADRTIRIYDLASLTQERVIEDHADWVLSVAWSPDGSRLASASRDKTAKLYDAATGDGLTTYSGHGEPVFGVAFSPDGKRVITAGADRKLHAWGVEDGAKKAEAGGFGREITALVAHEGTLLAAAADGGVQQFQGDELKTARSFGPLVDAVYALAFHAGSGRLAAAGYAGQVQLWKVEDGAPLTAITAAPGWAPPAASP